jgi:methylated-DNA-protein-cysteine methyltransferase related protein
MARTGLNKRDPFLPPGFKDSRRKAAEIREEAFASVIRSIPRGKVASYGQVATAAGYPRYHRAVAAFLKTALPGSLPWQRVLGANGEIKLAGRAATEQRLRLKLERVTFAGKRVDLTRHQNVFPEADSIF